ncbi:cation diffusion facilitator family transporter [Candidatus Stoquefichus massiliensis]|uniref:cation diffusion facilitator family transporter n=1 Tax=Candidatus Stoquefichus massiliensis TaxID=1470350 RepID=UPI000485C862|nr:cation diffusion facilitator family transporter [Candidatus Stoquefichus massiliensis]
MEIAYKETVYHVSYLTMIGNFVLSIFKFLAGLYGHSHAMISDSIHSLSDVISTVIVMIGVHFSSMPSDHEHPYGHERMECIAAIILSILLVFTGLQIGYNSLLSLLHPQTIVIPHIIALIAAIVSIIIKELMYWYTRYYAKKIHSPALMADAYHHRSDALSSIGSLVGIGGAMLGFKFLDPLAGVCICLFILKPGVCIFYDATIKMVDHSCSDEINDKLIHFILQQEYILSIDSLKTRMFSEKYYVDLEIGVNENLSLKEAHQIAHRTHDALEKEFPDIKHCMIHVNPKTN